MVNAAEATGNEHRPIASIIKKFTTLKIIKFLGLFSIFIFNTS
ncbi:MAG: hypothetical protein ACTSRP_12185 [Candidatus Helarchaeota archaeon]